MAYVLLHSSGQADARPLWLAVVHDAIAARPGAADGRRDADRAAGRDLLRRGAAQDRVRADRGRGPRMTEGGLEPAAGRLPLSAASLASRRGWCGGELSTGWAYLFSCDVRPGAGGRADRRRFALSGPDLLIADGRGGRRRDTARGGPRELSFPGNLALGVVDDVALTRRVVSGDRRRARCRRRELRPRAGGGRDRRSGRTRSSASGRSAPILRSWRAHVAALRRGRAERRRGRLRQALPRARRVAGRLASRAASQPRPTGETPDSRGRCRRSGAAVEAGVRAVMTAHARSPRSTTGPQR